MLPKMLATLLGFLAFCAVSSAVYILNDIRDVQKDRLHSTKKHRPLASGAISIKTAWILLVILLAVAAVLQYYSAPRLLPVLLLLVYLGSNVGYSLGLKNIPILDVAILSAGYLIRVLYGAQIEQIAISNWLYLTLFAFSFYLSLGKRRNELRTQEGETRAVLMQYSQGFLDKMMYLFLALTIVFYSLWTVDPITLSRLAHNGLVWTVPLVIIICMKYSFNMERGGDGDPIEVLLHDKILLALAAVFCLAMMGIIYY